MWCVCVWNYRRFASLDLTAFWRGGPMHWGRWHLQAQSCHGYYFCCVVWGKFRVCRAAFCVKLWMLGFGFDMSERMSEDMSESMWKDMSEDMSERVSKDLSERMSKDMSERCQKICQKICQKECQKICQKECQKICQKDVRKNVRRYVRKNVKRYVRRIYQKMCQKECQKICQKERQKIASSQSAKLRVTEHISGDELYVYPHLTRSGWHKSDGCGSLCEYFKKGTSWPKPISLVSLSQGNLKSMFSNSPFFPSYSQWQPSPDNLHPTCHGGDHSK